jgi:Mn-dependent DtxR family transcriptional regulator
MASEQIENYLKNIYKLSSNEGKVTTSSLSEKLQISPASVSEMIKKLAEEGTLTHTPYKGVELTDEGKKLALRIIRKHRLWEMFLVEVLHFRWDEIDDEAERFEHIMSDKMEEKIDHVLGHPLHRSPRRSYTDEGWRDPLHHELSAHREPGGNTRARAESERFQFGNAPVCRLHRYLAQQRDRHQTEDELRPISPRRHQRQGDQYQFHHRIEHLRGEHRGETMIDPLNALTIFGVMLLVSRRHLPAEVRHLFPVSETRTPRTETDADRRCVEAYLRL